MALSFVNLKLYKLQEVAETTGITIKALRDYCRSGELPARKVGSKWFVTEEALSNFFEGQKVFKKRESAIKTKNKIGAPKTRERPYIKKSFNLDRDLYALLFAISEAEKLTITDILQKAAREYLQKYFNYD